MPGKMPTPHAFLNQVTHTDQIFH